jgi:hypothetical protein
MTQKFETAKYIVQFAGRTVWVESYQDQAWVLCSQHSLPLPEMDVLKADQRFAALVSALRDFETTRSGDRSLRDALTETPRIHAAPAVSRPPTTVSHLTRNAPRARALSWSPPPLRPPLASRLQPVARED